MFGKVLKPHVLRRMLQADSLELSDNPVVSSVIQRAKQGLVGQSA